MMFFHSCQCTVTVAKHPTIFLRSRLQRNLYIGIFDRNSCVIRTSSNDSRKNSLVNQSGGTKRRFIPSPTWSMDDLRLSSSSSASSATKEGVTLDDLNVLAKRAAIDLNVYKLRFPATKQDEAIEVLRREVENMMNCLSVVTDFIKDREDGAGGKREGQDQRHRSAASFLTDEEIYDLPALTKYRKSFNDVRESLNTETESQIGKEVLATVKSTKMIQHKDGAHYFEVKNRKDE